MLYGTRYEALRWVLADTRRDASLTQSSLAERLGKPQSYVSKIESGERYMDVVNFILWCQACGANPVEILDKVVRGIEE